MSASVPSGFELVVAPGNDSYDPDDGRWQHQVAGLVAELDDRVDVTTRTHAVPGAKGAAVEVIVALGTAGAFTTTVECLRAWLGRDQSRRIDIRWSDDDGGERFVTLTGDAIDDASVREIARAAAHRVGGAGWPAGTGPSS